MDLRIVERFTRSLSRIERQLLEEELRLYRELRQAGTLAILNGSRLSEMRRELEAQFVTLSRSATWARQKQRPAAMALAQEYARQQAESLRSVGLRANDPGDIAMLSAEQALRQVLDAEPDWILAARSRTLADLSRLMAAGTEPERIAAELFSERIVNGRVSAWRAGKSSLATGEQIALWGAVGGAVGVLFGGVEAEMRLERQAIAAIDERTTDCCLRVHGQRVAQDQPFHLTGTPRFADYVHSPPFHWSCRTATAIYHVLMESVGTTTEEMRDAARSELQARSRTGRREEIHPAHATSRRST